ncbi:MAG: hypothetical protein ABJB03_02890 [Rhodoglobus sp.]
MSQNDELPAATEVDAERTRPVLLVGLLVFVGLMIGAVIVVVAVFLTSYAPPTHPVCDDPSGDCSVYNGPGG